MTFKTIKPTDKKDYEDVIALRQRILRDPLGLKLSKEDIKKEQDDLICICEADNKIIACCILTKISEDVVKLRQMAVDNSVQSSGIGTALLKFAEEVAVKMNFQTVELSARVEAKNFYLKSNYKIASEEFIEVGVPHVKMMKSL